MKKNRKIWFCKWLFAVLLFVGILLFNFYWFPKYTLEIGINIDLLDTRFYYHHNDVVQLFEELKVNHSLPLYKRMIIHLDLLYPLVYTLFFLMAFSIVNNDHSTSYINLFPIGIMIMDYLENLSVLKIIEYVSNDKMIPVHYSNMACLFTNAKWIFLVCTCSLLIKSLTNNKKIPFNKKANF